MDRLAGQKGDPETTTERETMIELDTLAARLHARLAELNAQAAEWEDETRIRPMTGRPG